MNKPLLFFLLIFQTLLSVSQNPSKTLDREDCITLIGIGQKMEGFTLYKKAIETYKDALISDSTCIAAYNLLGDVYFKIGEFGEAIKVYKKSLTINVNNYNAYNQLGIIYLNTGLIKESIDYFQRGLAIWSENLILLINLSDAFLSDNNMKDALSTATIALRVANESSIGIKNYAVVSKELGIIFYKCGAKKRSFESLSSAYKTFKKDAELNYYLGKFYDDVNNPDAKLYFKKAHKLGFKVEESILRKYEID